MRKAYNNFDFITHNDQFIGVSLGYDFCAEHEWGIKGIKRDFGVGEEETGILKSLFSQTKFGLPQRMITRGKIFFLEEGEFTFLCSPDHMDWFEKKQEKSLKKVLPRDLHLDGFNKKSIQTAWSENNFSVLTNDEQGRTYLKELKEAFDKNDIAIASLAGGPFANASLSLVIASKLPEEVTKQMYDADKSAHDLVEYEKKIGMTDLKAKVKSTYKGEKYFMACSAKWIKYGDEKAREEMKQKLGTKYNITYWVNYSDDDNNYGSYTVEEIKKWLSTPGLKLTQIRKAN